MMSATLFLRVAIFEQSKENMSVSIQLQIAGSKVVSCQNPNYYQNMLCDHKPVGSRMVFTTGELISLYFLGTCPMHFDFFLGYHTIRLSGILVDKDYVAPVAVPTTKPGKTGLHPCSRRKQC